MPEIIDKKTLEKLKILARIEIGEKRGEKMLKDLEKILGYFGELKNLDTSGIPPMSGGTFSRNVFRDDENVGRKGSSAASQFPEEEKKFLKVPPVFK